MNPLLKSAMLGTSKVNPPVINFDDPFDRLVQTSGGVSDETELMLLRRAGVRAIAELAGTMPRSIAAMSAAPAETLLAPTSQMSEFIELAMTTDRLDLLPELVEILTTNGIHFPHEHLPLAFEIAQPQRRELLRPILGERARWLAKFNPNWDWALKTPTDEDQLPSLEYQWNEGTFQERVTALEQVRKLQPKTALSWLEQSISKEKAEHRRKLMATLETNLSEEDLGFLELSQNDRSETVREVVRDLLLQREDSSISQRMRSRAAELIQANRQSDGALRLSIQLPDDFSVDWERDGIKLSSMKAPFGPDGVVDAIVGSVPPSFWLSHFDCPVEEFLPAAMGCAPNGGILRGLLRALERFSQNDPASLAFLAPMQSWIVRSLRDDSRYSVEVIASIQSLLKLSSADQGSAFLNRILRDLPDFPEDQLIAILNGFGKPWSLELSEAYLNSIRHLLKTYDRYQPPRMVASLMLASSFLHSDAFDSALAPWTISPTIRNRSDVYSIVEGLLVRFGQIVKHRNQFRASAEGLRATT
ncbi:DUF5691 domain-containing protein [Planctomicrobium sp. SH527]|uniref:DUF5691 domain-containing protein n=1 Tax=Planctomicrobium sp. SH527 TaxID=3448123 RepID=UPI003F5BA6A9